MNTARPAPRLNASRPNAPVPAKRSRTRACGISLARMLKTASLTFPPVGRISRPCTGVSFLPLYRPLIMRMGLFYLLGDLLNMGFLRANAFGGFWNIKFILLEFLADKGFFKGLLGVL